MSKEDVMEHGDSVTIKSPTGWTGSARGQSVALILVGGLFILLGYVHDAKTEDRLAKMDAKIEAAMTRVTDAVDANTFVISRPQAEREKLDITMPDSLRRKLRTGRLND